ncbi:MAG: ABC transporter permease [Gemmatimonadota bacterium]
MSISNWATRRLRALLHRDVLEADMNDELRLHFELAVADGVRRGLSSEQATAETRRYFGGVEQVKETYRDARGVRVIEELLRDVRYGFRALRRTPGFSIVVLLTLTLGIGANSAIFSVVRGVLLRALPYADPHRLVMVWEIDRDSGTQSENASIPDYFDFAARARSFSSLAAFAEQPLNYVATDGAPERVSAALVSGNFFPALGVPTTLGRGFSDAEDRPGGPRAVIVSDRFWRTRLGGARDVLGRILRLDEVSYAVVGVVPRTMQFPTAEIDLWVPLQLTPESGERSSHGIAVVGRLRSNVTIGAAQQEMTSLASQLEREYPRDNKARGVRLEQLEDTLLGPVRPALRILLGAVALVLLVACVNVANLMLARLTARGREVAVRSALGASGLRLTRQFVIESLILTLAASALALGLAPLTLRALVALAPGTLPRLNEVRLDGTVLAVTLGVAFAVAMAFGVLPAIASRGWGVSLNDHLRGGQRGGASPHQQRVRGALVMSEMALALVLLVGAALLMQSFWKLRRVDLGWSSTNVLRVQFQLPSTRYPQSYAGYPRSWSRILDFQRELLAQSAALPGARSAALASNDPLDPGFTNSFVIEGREAEARNGQAELATRPVSANYFGTLGIPLQQGRGFQSSDDANAAPVVLINEAAARKYFPTESAVGHRVRFWGTWRTIVGVVGNERFAGLAAEPPPAMYPPITQAPVASASLLIRTSGDPLQLSGVVRDVFRQVDPGIAPYGIASMTEVIDSSIAQRRFTMQLLAGFAALALGLALIGVYGVVSYGVARRTHEIGVRMALGATRNDVVRHVLRDGSRLACYGALLGALGALAATRLLSTQLYGVKSSDPVTLAVAAGAIVVIAIVGSYVPARRAARIAPVTALQIE